MRKVIFALVVLIFILGGVLKHQLMQVVISQVPASETYLNTNRCAQELLWFPIGSVFGLLFLLIPQKTIEWFTEPLSPKTKNYILAKANFGALRFPGFFMVLTAFLPFHSGPCINTLRNLLGR